MVCDLLVFFINFILRKLKGFIKLICSHSDYAWALQQADFNFQHLTFSSSVRVWESCWAAGTEGSGFPHSSSDRKRSLNNFCVQGGKIRKLCGGDSSCILLLGRKIVSGLPTGPRRAQKGKALHYLCLYMEVIIIFLNFSVTLVSDSKCYVFSLILALWIKNLSGLNLMGGDTCAVRKWPSI